MKEIIDVIKAMEEMRDFNYPILFKVNADTYNAMVRTMGNNSLGISKYSTIAGAQIVIDETINYGLAFVEYSDYTRKIIKVF